MIRTSTTLWCFVPQIPAQNPLTSSRHKSIPEQQILHGGGPVERRGVVIVDVEVEEVCDVVLQVVSDGGQLVGELDARAGQHGRLADTAQLEQLGGGYCAGAGGWR